MQGSEEYFPSSSDPCLCLNRGGGDRLHQQSVTLPSCFEAQSCKQLSDVGPELIQLCSYSFKNFFDFNFFRHISRTPLTITR